MDADTVARVALENQILRGVVGSTVHGTAVDGQDDRDEMGVFVEPREYVCGLEPIDHYVYRDQPDGVRSAAGDLDLVLYSLRKFCRLATRGNPTVLLLLWVPSPLLATPIGRDLIAMREEFISQESGRRFVGYLRAQLMRLTGERARTVVRPELVEEYGYDTKFAMHALRLGLQGIELLSDGRLTLPVREPDLTLLREVRTGVVHYEEAVRLIRENEAKLLAIVDNFTKHVDEGAISAFMARAHQEHWSGRK
jgi:predicted nucleotidyltransferase